MDNPTSSSLEDTVNKEIKNPEEPKYTRAAAWRNIAYADFETPSGMVVKIMELNDETLSMLLPILTSREDQTDYEFLPEVQKIIVPRHVIDPKVVETLEEETNDPNNCIFIEHIPMFDRFAIAMRVMGMEENFLSQVVTEKQRKRAELFRKKSDSSDCGDCGEGVAES